MPNPMLDKMCELLVHHYNMAGAMSREAAAKGMGVNEETYKHPYPGSTNYTINMTTPGEAKAEARAIVEPSEKIKENTTVVSTDNKLIDKKPGDVAGSAVNWLPWAVAGLAGAGLGGSVLAWALGGIPPSQAPSSRSGIVYEVYERDPGGGWKKSNLTAEELLGGKPLP